MKKPTTVTGYIAAAPKEQRSRLKALRSAIKKAAPTAEEKLSYGMPYYGLYGRLAYFASAKQHIGLYLMPPMIAEHKKELKDYVTSTATIQFPNDRPLPMPLIRKLLKIAVHKNVKKAFRICSRGHEFMAPGPCPTCWPGRLKKKK